MATDSSVLPLFLMIIVGVMTNLMLIYTFFTS